MSSNMFSGLAVDELDVEIEAELSELVIVDGYKTCEGRVCGVMTPEYCECEGACSVQTTDVVDELVVAPTTLVHSFFMFQACNPNLRGVLMAEAKKMFPNPEGSKFPSSIRVTFDPRVGYTITAYASTAEAADEMLSTFNTSVQLYVARRKIYVNVTNVNANTIDGFFREKNFRKVGPFTFNIVEIGDGLFIQMNRDKVDLPSYPTAEQEFWTIYQFLTLLTSTSDDVHILNVLRKISPEIDAIMVERKAASKKYPYLARNAAFNASGQRANPVTIADFLANFEIALPRGGKKGKKN